MSSLLLDKNEPFLSTKWLPLEVAELLLLKEERNDSL